jgi:hypothetical protein
MRKINFQTAIWDIVLFLVYVGLTIVFIYFLRGILTYLFFAVLFLLFYKSKKNYLWFAYLFTFIETPGGLFYYGSKADLVSAPLITIGSGFSFTIPEIFFLVALIKALQLGKRNFSLFQKELHIFLIFIPILYFYSILIGMSMDAHLSSLRVLFVFSLLYSFPRLMQSESDYKRFYLLISIMVFFVFLAQGLLLTTQSDLVKLLTGQSQTRFAVREVLLERPIFSTFLLFFAFIISLFYLMLKKSGLKRTYLLLVALISFLAIFLTATRGWIVSFSIISLLFIFFNRKINFFNILGILLIGSLLVSTSLKNPILGKQLAYSVERTSTLESFAEGDITAEGTLNRLTVRGPAVMESFKQSPIIGWGFSDRYGYKGDAHVGLQSTLALTGIIGMLLFIWFWARYIVKVRNINNRLQRKNPYKGALVIFIVGFLGLLIINATSTMFFGFFPMGDETSKIFLFTTYLSFTSFYSKEGIKTNYLISHE